MGLVLSLDQTITVNFTLTPGEQKKTVIVVDRVEELVESATSSLSEVIEEKQIRDLPLNGRNFQLLLGPHRRRAARATGQFLADHQRERRARTDQRLQDRRPRRQQPVHDQIRVQPNQEANGRSMGQESSCLPN